MQVKISLATVNPAENVISEAAWRAVRALEVQQPYELPVGGATAPGIVTPSTSNPLSRESITVLRQSRPSFRWSAQQRLPHYCSDSTPRRD